MIPSEITNWMQKATQVELIQLRSDSHKYQLILEAKADAEAKALAEAKAKADRSTRQAVSVKVKIFNLPQLNSLKEFLAEQELDYKEK